MPRRDCTTAQCILYCTALHSHCTQTALALHCTHTALTLHSALHFTRLHCTLLPLHCTLLKLCPMALHSRCTVLHSQRTHSSPGMLQISPDCVEEHTASLLVGVGADVVASARDEPDLVTNRLQLRLGTSQESRVRQLHTVSAQIINKDPQHW